MSFNLDDFLHKPQLPSLANQAYYDVVKSVAPSQNPPHAILRTIEQLAKGLVFDTLVNIGDTRNGAFFNLAKSGVTSCSPYIPYTFLFKNEVTGQAALTGFYQAPDQNILPSLIHKSIVRFHERVRFDVDFINNHSIKQVALIEIGIPYSPGLSLKETVDLFRDTFARFLQYPQLTELYRMYGYTGSQMVTSVTTNSGQAWNCSVKILLVLNAFDSEDAGQRAQTFANHFTNLWVNAIASVSEIDNEEELQTLANTVADNFLNFTFHATAEHIMRATPNVNQQLFGLERFLLDNEELVKSITTDDIVDGSLNVHAFGNLTPCQLLRLSTNPNLHADVQTWCIDKWLEYATVFADSDNVFLPDEYYLYVMEYGLDASQGQISKARQDFFFDLAYDSQFKLMAKLPINLCYTLINPCMLDTSLLNIAERRPEALYYFLQVLCDLHNNVFSQLLDSQQYAAQGQVQLYLPEEWLHLCTQISPELIGIAVAFSNQAIADPQAPEVASRLQAIEDRVNDWLQNDFYRKDIAAGKLELTPRRKVLRNTYVTYTQYSFVDDVVPTESELRVPYAILAANVYNTAFDAISDISREQMNEAKEKLSPQAHARQVQERMAARDSLYKQKELRDSQRS